MKQYIELKKQRDLGLILSDAFGFIRNEFKPFFTLILQIVAPYLIAMFASLAFYFYAVGDISNLVMSTSGFGSPEGSLFAMFVAMLALTITGLIAYVLAHAAALFYMKSYSENKGIVNTTEIRDNVKASFWSFVGLGILIGLAVFFGFLICFFPGVYLIVPLSLAFSIMVFKNKNATDAFSDSFKFIKGEWWLTFLTIIVIAIIVGIIGFVFNIPAMIYSIIKMGVFSGELDPADQTAIFKDPIYIILNLLGYAFKYFLNFITIISTALIYFNINEKKNFTGTLERIESIGTKHD